MKRNISFISLFLIAVFSFGFQQQGRKSTSLDNDDLSPFTPPPGPKLLEISPGEYSSDGSGFSMRFLAKPESLSFNIPSDLGELTVNALELRSTGIQYMVGYCDYPPIIDVSEPLLIYSGYKEATIRRYGWSLDNEREIHLNDKTGREFAFSKDNERGIVRLYLVSNRMYIAVFSTTEKRDRSKEANQFFSSFKIIPR